MNIFYLDKDVEICAKYHCDKHVVKMILESAQLLCNVHDVAPYKRTHINHPCSKWVKSSLSHYNFLCNLLENLLNEYTKRYKKIHKTYEVFNWLKNNNPNLKDLGFIDPPQCMPDKYKQESTVMAYRNYYNCEKSKFAKWKNSEIPSWFENHSNNSNQIL
jgi:hypothetical protein